MVIAAGALALVSAGLYAITILSPATGTISLRGTLTIGGGSDDRGGIYEGDSCGGRKEYADVIAGSKTVAYDGHNDALLGVTSLEPGHIDSLGNCVFRFSFTDITKAGSYALEVASRGQHWYSYSQLAAHGFTINLVLGQLSTVKLPERSLGKGESASQHYEMQDLSSDQSVKQ